eukprot:3599265-Prymnesium_polylepis.1
MAASEAAKEAIYLKRFLEQFGLQDPEQPVTLKCDHQAAITWLTIQNITSGLNISSDDTSLYYVVHEKVEENMIEVPYVRTVDNLADFFTKPLMGDVFFNMCDQIMNCGICGCPEWGLVERCK